MLRRFVAEESGAITVDWVVITAGVVTLSLATMGVVSGGISALSRDTGNALSGYEIQTRFATFASALTDDFSGGIGNWMGGTFANLVGFGEVLQLGPGEMAQTTISVPAGANSATITFDMLGIDDLSGEPASIMINGEVVALYSDNHGNITTSDMGVSGVSVSVAQQYSNDPMGAGSHGHDSRATYTITVANPGETLTFGVASGTGQPISEEFYAIDDVSITTD